MWFWAPESSASPPELHLLSRGRSVAILERTGVASETSFGNAGMIQSEAVFPYMFPRSLSDIALAAANQDPRAEIRYHTLPQIAPALWRYYLASTPEGRGKSARAMRDLVGNAKGEHIALAQAANAMGLFRDTGWIKVFRSAFGEGLVHEEIEELKPYGVQTRLLDREALTALEPSIGDRAIGGVHFPDPITTSDPGALVNAYADLFVSRGGVMLTGDAMSLAEDPQGWSLEAREGRIIAPSVVVALGPWSAALARRAGLSPAVLRQTRLSHALCAGRRRADAACSRYGEGLRADADGARAAADHGRRIRSARRRPFAKTSGPDRAVRARDVHLRPRLDPEPWMGRRPCLPDMLPVIGAASRHQGLWFDFAHQHLG